MIVFKIKLISKRHECADECTYYETCDGTCRGELKRYFSHWVKLMTIAVKDNQRGKENIYETFKSNQELPFTTLVQSVGNLRSH